MSEFLLTLAGECESENLAERKLCPRNPRSGTSTSGAVGLGWGLSSGSGNSVSHGSSRALTLHLVALSCVFQGWAPGQHPVETTGMGHSHRLSSPGSDRPEELSQCWH